VAISFFSFFDFWGDLRKKKPKNEKKRGLGAFSFFSFFFFRVASFFFAPYLKARCARQGRKGSPPDSFQGFSDAMPDGVAA
jgi:hypothetical protein